MTTIEKLKRIFSDFPGIGPRQSHRFVYFLLTRRQEYIDDMIELLKNLKKETSLCLTCFRYFTKNGGSNPNCVICNDQNRENSLLMLVARDIDLENMEKSGAYKGRYFVLGGIVPILEEEPEKRIRIKELLGALEKESPVEEIIIAMNANPDGDNTEEYLKERLADTAKNKNIKISTLGRGLSTGIELEYSDKDTLASAFKNRH